MDPTPDTPASNRTLQNGEAMDTDIVLLSLDSTPTSSLLTSLGVPSSYAQQPSSSLSAVHAYSSQLYMSSTPSYLPAGQPLGPLYNPYLYTLNSQAVTPSQISVASTTAQLSPIIPSSFPGVRRTSQRGGKPVLIYNVPNTTTCYSFQSQRSNKMYDLYSCIGCKHAKPLKKFVSIKVVSDDFCEDPSLLLHVCTPKEMGEEESTRIGYKVKNELRQCPDTVNRPAPVQVWQNTLHQIRTDSQQDTDSRSMIADSWSEGGLKRQRSALSKAINAGRDRKTSMTDVPDQFAKTVDGEVFLQKQTLSFHLYYSLNTFRALSETVQLYQVDPRSLTIVMDFEDAAHAAAEEFFRPEKVVGCLFHLSQALNRRRDLHGLRRFTEGKDKDDDVASWYKQVLGLPYLPKNLVENALPLRSPPVPIGHEAYLPCAAFLTYHKKEWMGQKKVPKWNKWMVVEHRTSNLAESYHRKLQTTLGADHTQLGKLLLQIQKEDVAAEQALRSAIKGSQPRIDKRDLLRRTTVEAKMDAFALQMNSAALSDDDIVTYLLEMSAHVTHKSHKKK